MNGTWLAAATSATAELSMSTATAPVSRRAAALAAAPAIGCMLVSSAPDASGRHEAIEAVSASRHEDAVANRVPSGATTSRGRHIVPA